MSRSRAYRRISVKNIELGWLRERGVEQGGRGTSVGLDIAKDEIVAVVRWPDEGFERPWSVRNPGELELLIARLQVLKQVCDSLVVGLESTGTYGEAVRRALTLAGIQVHRISGKATSDYKEIFDGVPSQHDGKDAAIIAELAAYGKGTPWPFEEDGEALQYIKFHVRRMDAFRTEQVQWLGRLEGLVALHWPELSGLLKLGSVTLLKMLAHYGNPAVLAADPEAAARLSKWGRSKMTSPKIAALIESARTTRGVPVNEGDVLWIKEVAAEALSSQREIQRSEKELRVLAAAEPAMHRNVGTIGAGTLGVIWATVGDPRKYGSSGAFLKALGLNLKELSSGRRQGQLAITKRGPSRARRWIFYWALRGIQRAAVTPWYEEFIRVGNASESKSSGEHRKMKAVVALMRKQCRGLWHSLVHDEDFDYGKLFPAGERPARISRKRRRRRRAAV